MQTDVVHSLPASIARIHSMVGSSSTSGRVPIPPGTTRMSAPVTSSRGEVGDEREHSLLGAYRAALGGDEADRRSRQPLQYLVRTDRVERGQTVEDENRDIHRSLLLTGP